MKPVLVFSYTLPPIDRHYSFVFIGCSALRCLNDSEGVKLVKERVNKKWQIGYRTATTVYPCFLPDLGEFDRSWSYRFAVTKLITIAGNSNQFTLICWTNNELPEHFKEVFRGMIDVPSLL